VLAFFQHSAFGFPSDFGFRISDFNSPLLGPEVFPVSMAGSKARLVGLTKELSLKWNETKNYWRDAKAQEFERKYLQELFIGVDKTVGIVEKLDELLKQVRKDCE
jgi:hypothetical protein